MKVQECGERLYWHIKNISDEEASKLAQYLDASDLPLTPNNNSAQHSPSINTSNSQSSTHPNSTEATSTSEGSQSDAECTINMTRMSGINVAGLRHQRYLELCFNSGRYHKKLSELNLTDTKSDGELFQAISDLYYRQKSSFIQVKLKLPEHWERWFCKASYDWSFMKPTSKSFCKVSKPQLPGL